MAKLSPNGKSVTVEKGDTLSEIALTYYARFGYKDYKTYMGQLIIINKLSNPNLIIVGEVLRLTGTTPTVTQSVLSNVKVTKFGLQSNTDRTVYAVWSWDRSNTKQYQIQWYYSTGDGVWFQVGDSTATIKQSVYNAPSNAESVKFRVRPIATTRKVNGKDTAYWTATWSNYSSYSFYSNPPKTPPVPEVKLEGNKLTMSLSNLDVNANEIVFEVCKDDSVSYCKLTATIKTSAASCKQIVAAGNRYKVRCRAKRNSVYSDWSAYSSNVLAIPERPSGIVRCQANSETSVYISWNAAKAATSYDIEYATDKTYFDGSDQTTVINNITSTHYIKTGLEPNKEYFFRVRSVNSSGNSTWTEISSIAIGKAPSAPTTWSSTTTAVTGEQLKLHWVHNGGSEDLQRYAEIELDVNGVRQFIEIDDTAIEDENDKTYEYVVDTSGYLEGVKLLWRVRTKGVVDTYSDWSVQRTIDIYSPPYLELEVMGEDGDVIDGLTSFPIYISANAGPNTQKPIGYHVSIISNGFYDTIDDDGFEKSVSQGDEVYSKYFDISDPLVIQLLPSDVDLSNNIDYTIKCVVTMDSGLTAEQTYDIFVRWVELLAKPNAQISIDSDAYSVSINPYCEHTPIVYHVVSYNADTDEYTETMNECSVFGGSLVADEYTDTGYPVYSNGEFYYCIVESDETALDPDVVLAVYRREFDGRMVEIGSDIPNNGCTFVTDPHPSLDYARYRITATSKTTGVVSYTDIPGYPIGCKSILIQWDEDWSSFDTTNEDAQEQPSWTGSMVKLPYNIDVSEKTKPDVELIEYIGRKNPVSYYGTQVGETQVWNSVIAKDDVDTLYALRRLNKWMGDVYVREPSGCGFWANVNVTFGRKNRDLTIPVTLDIVRVEGGV